MPRILVAEPRVQAGIELLSAAHETSVRNRPPRAELLAALAEAGGWDALIVHPASARARPFPATIGAMRRPAPVATLTLTLALFVAAAGTLAPPPPQRWP
jgi:hypothetical protein